MVEDLRFCIQRDAQESDVDDRKSTTSVAFFLGTSMVSCLSHKHKWVSLSLGEAEYIAATIVACQVWLERLIGDHLSRDLGKVVFNIDNKSNIISLWKIRSFLTEATILIHGITTSWIV
jgi:hypothetical protein